MRLFISFAREDLPRVRQLAEMLEHVGHQPWFDDKLVPGLPWADQLLERIRQSEVFVYALSPHSVSSEWCQREYQEAAELSKPVLPVLLEAGTQLPPTLAGVQWANFTPQATPVDLARLIGGLPQMLTHPARVPQAPAEPQGVPTRALDLDQASEPLPAEPAPVVPPPVLPSAETSSTEIHDLLSEVYAVRESNPERALLLLYQLQTMDPEFMGPKTPEYVAQQEARLKPIRLANMQAQAEALVAAGEWSEAERVALSMVELDSSHGKFLRSVLDSWIETLLAARDWDGAEAVSLRLQKLGGPGSRSQLLRVRQTAARGLAEGSDWERALEFAQRTTDPAFGKDSDIREEILGLWGEAALAASDWTRAEQVGHGMLEVGGSPTAASRLIELARTNAQYERQYLQALSLRRHGRDAVAFALLEDLKVSCPTYGDPQGILSGRPIDPVFASWIRRQKIPDIPAAEDRLRKVLRGSDHRSRQGLRAVGNNKVIKLEDAVSGETVGLLRGHKDTVGSLVFSWDGALLASNASTSSVWIWHVAAQTRAALVNGRTGDWFSSLAFAPTDQLLAAIGYYGIAIWQRIEQSDAFAPNPTYLTAFQALKASPWTRMSPVSENSTVQASSIAFSPDSRLLVSGWKDGRITLWDLVSFKPLITLPSHDSEVTGVAFFPDGKGLVSAAADGTLTLWGMGDLDGPL